MAGKNKKKTSKASKTALQTVNIESYKNKIITFLQKCDKKYIVLNELEKKCRSKKYGRDNFNAAFDELRQNGIIILRKSGRVSLCSRINCRPGAVTRLSRTFGFARADENNLEYFIPGKFMLGAMPGDRVLISDINSRTGEPEGEILDIIQPGSSVMTGNIEFIDNIPYLVPDCAPMNHITIIDADGVQFDNGDKVLAEITVRGKKHSEHKVRIVSVFGSSESAAACADAVVAAHGVNTVFPDSVVAEARKISEGGVQVYSFNNREDLRDLNIFTIDSAESKDMDDAVSVEIIPEGYRLGVHIADVSNYVKGNSELDKEALRRGTSVYYADKVIPMLPEALSNGICSLNPGENRLTLSAFIDISPDGSMLSYRFVKSVICSVLKGVYKEVNAVLDGTETPEIREKYAPVRDSIFLFSRLADILTAKKNQRHAPVLETVESRLIIDSNGVCTDVQPASRGKAEQIIEVFMLTANEAAAKLAAEKCSPFVYRVHEKPPAEKIQDLREILPAFGLSCPEADNFRPYHAAAILEQAKDTPYYQAVNLMVLRSMSKAKYSPEPLGHFGLALKDYAHFTSPIRRYPDLAVHRIITDILAGYSCEWLAKRYSGFAAKAAEASSGCELTAIAVERECDECYKAEFMKGHIGEVFTGKISSVTESGFYVMLPSSVEGMVHIRNLPQGEYNYQYPVSLTEAFSGVSYRLGDMVRVICTAVNVSEGKIDLSLDDDF